MSPKVTTLVLYNTEIDCFWLKLTLHLINGDSLSFFYRCRLISETAPITNIVFVAKCGHEGPALLASTTWSTPRSVCGRSVLTSPSTPSCMCMITKCTACWYIRQSKQIENSEHAAPSFYNTHQTTNVGQACTWFHVCYFITYLIIFTSHALSCLFQTNLPILDNCSTP